MSSEEVKQETNNGQTNQQQPEEAKPVVEKKILCKYSNLDDQDEVKFGNLY